MRQLLDAEPATDVRARPVRKHEQDLKTCRRAREHLEEITRQRIEPVAVLEHHDDRLRARPGAQVFDQQSFERGLAQLRIERRREIVVGNGQVEQPAEQRRPGHEAGVDRREFGLQRADLRSLGQVVVKAKQRRPDRAPDEIAGVRTVRLALADGDDTAPPRSDPGEFGRQTRLPHARLGRDADDAAATSERLVELRTDRVEFRPAADDREVGAGRRARCVPLRAGQRKHGHRLGLALDRHRGQRVPVEHVAGGAPHRFGDIDLARRRIRHQPRREVDGIAETGERLPAPVAVRAAAQPSVRDPDLDARRRRRRFEVAQLERCGCCARRVVLVRLRRAEHRRQIRALVAERQVQQVAAIRGQNALHMPDEIVEFRDRVFIVVEVDAFEADEHRVRRPQLRQKLAAPGGQPLVDHRQQPLPDDRLRQRILVGRRRCVRHVHHHVIDDTDFTAGLAVDPALANPDPVAEGIQRRPVEHDLGTLGQLFGRGERIDEPPPEDVDQLDVRVAHQESPGRPNGDGGLHREANACAGRRDHLADFAHLLLHRERAGGGARAVVAIDPAGDRIAAEVDDVAAETLESGDKRVEEPVEVGGQLLGAALRAELVRQRFGQRREARDVREQRSTANAVGYRDPRGERVPAVAGDVGLQVVGCGRRSRRRVPCNALCLGHVRPSATDVGDTVDHRSRRPPIPRSRGQPGAKDPMDTWPTLIVDYTGGGAKNMSQTGSHARCGCRLWLRQTLCPRRAPLPLQPACTRVAAGSEAREGCHPRCAQARHPIDQMRLAWCRSRRDAWRVRLKARSHSGLVLVAPSHIQDTVATNSQRWAASRTVSRQRLKHATFESPGGEMVHTHGKSFRSTSS